MSSISAATTTPSATSAPTRRGRSAAAACAPSSSPTASTGMTYTREGEIIKCPWHQWEFDIKTGQALYDPKLRVRTYRVEVEDEQVVLYV